MICGVQPTLCGGLIGGEWKKTYLDIHGCWVADSQQILAFVHSKKFDDIKFIEKFLEKIVRPARDPQIEVTHMVLCYYISQSTHTN